MTRHQKSHLVKVCRPCPLSREYCSCPAYPAHTPPPSSQRHQRLYSLDSGQGRSRSVRRNVERFRGGLVLKAHRLLYHSTLCLRVIKKEKKQTMATPESRKGSPKVNFLPRQWCSKVNNRTLARLRLNQPPPRLWRGATSRWKNALPNSAYPFIVSAAPLSRPRLLPYLTELY